MKATLNLSANFGNNLGTNSKIFSQSQKNTPVKIGGPISNFNSSTLKNGSNFRMKRDDSV